MLLHRALKCIPVMWIKDKAPTLNPWMNTVTSLIPLEAFSTALKDKPFLFYQAWDHFFECLGDSKSHRVKARIVT